MESVVYAGMDVHKESLSFITLIILTALNWCCTVRSTGELI